MYEIRRREKDEHETKAQQLCADGWVETGHQRISTFQSHGKLSFTLSVFIFEFIIEPFHSSGATCVTWWKVAAAFWRGALTPVWPLKQTGSKQTSFISIKPLTQISLLIYTQKCLKPTNRRLRGGKEQSHIKGIGPASQLWFHPSYFPLEAYS